MKNVSKKKVVKNSVSYKKLSGRTCLSLPGVELEALMIAMFTSTEMGKWIHFRAQQCQKYRLYQFLFEPIFDIFNNFGNIEP